MRKIDLLKELVFGKDTKSEIKTLPADSSFYDLGGSVIYGTTYPIITAKFDGEKTLGELGAVFNSIPDYERLRLRTYDAFLKTDTVKILTEKHVDWTIGSGLKLQSEPSKEFLELNKISVDVIEFQKSVETRFNLYSNSKYCDYSEERTLHQLANDVFKAKFLGGDALVICRVDSTGVNAQFVSGSHVKTPMTNDPLLKEVQDRGNNVRHGIEFDVKGKQVAYFVQVFESGNLIAKFIRVPAYGKSSKRKVAWMVYGQKISPDHVRGVPEMAQTLEKINKLDRYTEASVGKAEQAAKITYAIEHEVFSTGEDVLQQIADRKNNILKTEDGHTLGNGLAQTIVETTSNQTFNMPVGAKLKAFNSEIESNYSDFESANFNKIAAAANVPPEVALQMYNSNYSASRAAINGWGYVVSIDRNDFALDFYIPFFKLWLEVEILSNRIEAPGYIKALDSNDFMILEAYSKCRFIGKNMPHIDPLKEVKAIREMLGNTDENKTPLISREQATEMLNVGDFHENFSKFTEENKTQGINTKPKEDEAI